MKYLCKNLKNETVYRHRTYLWEHEQLNCGKHGNLNVEKKIEIYKFLQPKNGI